MNGLKFIRTRCNVTIGELSDLLGISRQAVSAWENGRKAISSRCLQNLSEYFGVEEIYFGEINNDQKKELLYRPMFVHDLKGKEIYRYVPSKNETVEKQIAFFLADNGASLSERYHYAIQKKYDVINRISNIIEPTELEFAEDKIGAIVKNALPYENVSEIMEKLFGTENCLKVLFRYEIMNVLNSMLIAYGLKDYSELKLCDGDEDWIQELSERIKNHWEEKSLAEMNRITKYLEDRKEENNK